MQNAHLNIRIQIAPIASGANMNISYATMLIVEFNFNFCINISKKNLKKDVSIDWLGSVGRNRISDSKITCIH